jgi:hypothetical protein
VSGRWRQVRQNVERRFEGRGNHFQLDFGNFGGADAETAIIF